MRRAPATYIAATSSLTAGLGQLRLERRDLRVLEPDELLELLDLDLQNVDRRQNLIEATDFLCVQIVESKANPYTSSTSGISPNCSNIEKIIEKT